jgi:hypothetical protein
MIVFLTKHIITLRNLAKSNADPADGGKLFFRLHCWSVSAHAFLANVDWYAKGKLEYNPRNPYSYYGSKLKPYIGDDVKRGDAAMFSVPASAFDSVRQVRNVAVDVMCLAPRDYNPEAVRFPIWLEWNQDDEPRQGHAETGATVVKRLPEREETIWMFNTGEGENK